MFNLGPDALRRRRADFFDRQGIGRLEDRQGGPADGSDVLTPGDATGTVLGGLDGHRISA